MQSVLRPLAPRAAAPAVANCTQPGPSPRCPGLSRPLTSQHRKQIGAPGRGRESLQICRITSTSRELFASDAAKELNMSDDGEETYMDLPDYQVYDPDLGPLEKRIQRSYLDAVNSDIVDLRESEYWFTTPEGGWNSVPERVRYMDEDPEPAFPQPYHSPHTEQGADRIAYSELDEGKVYLGVITDVWLYHGVQVDIGAEFDVLIPCTEDLWEIAVDHINVGTPVLIEIHKLRTPGLYRWPVQAKFCEAVMQDLMMHPDDYECPVDHAWAAEAGWSAEEVAAATGRTIEATTYYVPPDDNELAVKVQDGYGTGLMPWRDENSPPIEDYIDDPMDNPEDDAVLGRGRANVAAAIKSLGYTP